MRQKEVYFYKTYSKKENQTFDVNIIINYVIKQKNKLNIQQFHKEDIVSTIRYNDLKIRSDRGIKLIYAGSQLTINDLVIYGIWEYCQDLDIFSVYIRIQRDTQIIQEWHFRVTVNGITLEPPGIKYTNEIANIKKLICFLKDLVPSVWKNIYKYILIKQRRCKHEMASY